MVNATHQSQQDCSWTRPRHRVLCTVKKAASRWLAACLPLLLCRQSVQPQLLECAAQVARQRDC